MAVTNNHWWQKLNMLQSYLKDEVATSRNKGYLWITYDPDSNTSGGDPHKQGLECSLATNFHLQSDGLRVGILLRLISLSENLLSNLLGSCTRLMHILKICKFRIEKYACSAFC